MKQVLQTNQSLGLSQRQLQTMNLLAMTAVELEQYLDEAALENPLIDVVRPDVEVLLPQGGFAGGRPEGVARAWDIAEADQAEGPDIEAYLLSQVDDTRLAPEELQALRYLIGMIDENGYLTQSVEQAAQCLGADRTTVARMAAVLLTLEPHGIGARTVRESLLVQLAASHPDANVAAAIVRDHLALLAKNRIDELKRAVPGATHDGVVEAVRLIRSLDPRPGARFSAGRAQYVLADIVVEQTDEGFEVGLGPAGGFDVRIDGACRAAVKQGVERGAQEWMEAKCRQAYGLRASLKQRRELMLAIAEQVVRRQKAFFALGPRYRESLTMSQIAEDLSLSVSTVSRAVKGSYVQCRWGVLPLKALFAHSTIARSSSSDDPRELLKEIVAGEDRARPLSDQKIVEEFARRGVELSRRTVARFRQEAGIPSASERKYR